MKTTAVTWLCCANTTEHIKVLLGVEALGDPRNIVLDDSTDFLHEFNAAFAKLLRPVVIIISH